MRERFPRASGAGILAALAAAVLAAAAPAVAQPPAEMDGASGLGLALRQLGTTKRVLMIGAHPDDENTAVLSELALGHGADVAYLSLTRGEGGQNLIGPELDEPLGLIRSEELLAARRLDGARQFFTRAYDFGFSRDADETFRQWPRDSLLADVVLVIRRYRPDVIVPVFSGTPRDGHGHHQASGILAREAFDAAADPARFPGQIEAGLRPHRAAALYQALYRGEPDDAVVMPTGELDPLLGRSRYQVAMASRSRHRSQDMGRAEPLGPQRSLLVRQDAPGAAGVSLFAGIDTTLSGHARTAGAAAPVIALLERYEAEVADVRRDFNPFTAYALAPRLAGALGVLARADSIAAAMDTLAALRFHLRAERGDASDALARAAGLVFDATADDARVVPGQTFELAITLWNGGTGTVRVRGLEPHLPDGWTSTPLDDAPASLEPSAIVVRRFRVQVANGATPTVPYFLRAERPGEIYAWPEDVALRALPFEPPAVRARADVEIAGEAVALEGEATFVDVDKALGERRRPVLVVPALSIMVNPPLLVVPLAADAAAFGGGPAAREIAVVVTSEAPGGIEATVAIEVPAGWAAAPASTIVAFAAPGETRTLRFRVTPPSGLRPGSATVRVLARAGGIRYDRGVQIVDYPHTRIRTLYHDAAIDVEAFDVAIAPALRVGYIEGAGDDGALALAQLGATVEPLDAQALANADLTTYDAIVAGIRAYEVRPDLAAHNDRLLDYVRGGGVAIIQYNKYEYPDGNFAPLPLTMARPHGRVTDENAAVRLLDAEHPALRWPNRIGGRDLEGWVQERGLYFADTWDDRYSPLLEMADPGEPPLRGSLLVAPVGEGFYVYTGLALFRQIPEGVPGAYRLLANLVSLGKAPPR
jgi:LmbE family N-acetylglucosaminyl deacetylase